MKTTRLISTREQRRNNTSTGSNGTREEWRPDVTAWARCGSTHSWIYILEIAPGAISPMGVRKYEYFCLASFSDPGAISPMGALSRMITVA